MLDDAIIFGKFISPLDYDDGIFDEEDLVPVQEKTQEEKNEEWNQKRTYSS